MPCTSIRNIFVKIEQSVGAIPPKSANTTKYRIVVIILTIS